MTNELTIDQWRSIAADLRSNLAAIRHTQKSLSVIGGKALPQRIRRMDLHLIGLRIGCYVACIRQHGEETAEDLFFGDEWGQT